MQLLNFLAKTILITIVPIAYCMSDYLSVSDVAKQLRVSASAVRTYASQGKIPFETTPYGHRRFRQSDVDIFLGVTPNERIVFYARSSQGEQSQLDSQTRSLTKKYGEPNKIYSDKASGLNDKRRGLTQLLAHAKKGTFNILCITQKDRLTRFGFTHLEELFSAYGVEVRVLGEGNTATPVEELLQDFMSLLASFSGKFYRLRGYEQQKQLLNKAHGVIDGKE